MPVDAAPTRRSSADAAAVSLSATAVGNSGDSLEDSAMECSSVWKSERGVAQQNRQVWLTTPLPWLTKQLRRRSWNFCYAPVHSSSSLCCLLPGRRNRSGV